MKAAAETCPAPPAVECQRDPLGCAAGGATVDPLGCEKEGATRDPLGRCFLVINPGSRGGKGAETAARYRGLLEEWKRGQRSAAGRDEPSESAEPAGLAGPAELAEPAGLAELACGYTRELDDARMLARRALDEGYDTVVAVGGDGTINRVVSAFMEAGAVRPADRSAPRLGILYAGTSPDFCRFHGIPIDPVEAVAVLRQGLARPIDICRIEHRDGAGRARVDFFASSANIGLGAGIAARANRLRPRCGDFGGTLLATLLTIAGCRPRRMRLVIDDEEIPMPPALNVCVGKNPYLASGLKLETRIAPGDGRLFVFAVCGIGRLQLLGALPRIYSGAITRDVRFLLRRATRVRVEAVAGDLRTEFDGDPAGWCPTEIRVLPGALRLIGGVS